MKASQKVPNGFELFRQMFNESPASVLLNMPRGLAALKVTRLTDTKGRDLGPSLGRISDVLYMFYSDTQPLTKSVAYDERTIRGVIKDIPYWLEEVKALNGDSLSLMRAMPRLQEVALTLYPNNPWLLSAQGTLEPSQERLSRYQEVNQHNGGLIMEYMAAKLDMIIIRNPIKER